RGKTVPWRRLVAAAMRDHDQAAVGIREAAQRVPRRGMGGGAGKARGKAGEKRTLPGENFRYGGRAGGAYRPPAPSGCAQRRGVTTCG
ncbi:hypothetical protein LXJ58_31145, partial [Escherichia coli]|nr:hypothetical protein [Escherichia coli]